MDTSSDMAALRAIVVMGVSGCGKSSVARACAGTLGWDMREGDDFHTPDSIAKMRAGVPLTDEDRAAWLDQLARLLAAGPSDPANQGGLVLTCSALRRRYRDRLRKAQPRLGFVFLRLGYEEALARVSHRAGHFFSPALVADQFASLESPEGEAGVLALDARVPVEVLAQQAVAWITQAARRVAPP